ncbi:family 43 glycosylhydrolase [Alkalitalea saponilacus]|uniref:Glycosyl hydrolases family 43 n=1 Tax=Alkalitalea saponilacus TaxID=889453 RepID=A0A1T5CGZ6_9BACT|nr:family 43 glycosylhydrolase [Alkalitalea saponilacus]ASB49867.1 hypothetical protein CDL62_12335 [Alkalitalea saponilacus]SKB58729.1 Glycosyl hydrolases family 43 [Alkalitalea saponilacus]
MKRNYFYFTLSLVLLLVSCHQSEQDQVVGNPLFGGYFGADPAIVEYEGKFYIYATKDPWGGDDLAVFVTEDFLSWEEASLNWPTKEACTSPTSLDANVWAPDVIQGKDGRFYMYISVGSEIWAGGSDHPLGPWENLKADNTPLIPSDFIEGIHHIDANCFIDDDGKIYLYWGSGWDWVNGRCLVVRLDDDMKTFLEEPQDVTPPNFFEGAFMIKRNGQYYLMYSDGMAINETYHIRYSVGDTPYGPWREGKYSPILQSTPDGAVVGPGHHSVFRVHNQDYILYHRIYPQEQEYVLRQLCLDSLNYDAKGNILPISLNSVPPFE